jgi:hypothetical protein
MQGAVDGLPPRHGRGRQQTGEMDKIDGPYYFFKLIQRTRQILPPWMPMVGLEGGRVNIVPVDFVVNCMDFISHKPAISKKCFHLVDPRGLPRGRRAGHLQQGRPRAQDEPVRQRGAAGLHPQERQEDADGHQAGAPRPQRHHGTWACPRTCSPL